MARNWPKFKLLLWKNWLLQWRHKTQLAVEILAPVVFTTLLVVVRSLVDPEERGDPTYPHPFKFESFVPEQLPYQVVNPPAWTIAWSPYNPVLEKVMQEAVHLDGSNLTLNSYASANQLLANLTDPTTGVLNTTVAGVQFPDSFKDITELPEKVTFRLRFPSELRYYGQFSNPLVNNWHTNLLFPIFQTGGPRLVGQADGGLPPGYVPEGFATLQNIISRGLINYHLKQLNKPVPDVQFTIQRYPYPAYIEDPLLVPLQGFVSVVIMLSFVYTCTSTVKVITTEKEKQLKESMKIMGLSNWLHWTAWFIKTFSFVLVSLILIVVLLKVQWYSGSDMAVLTHSNGFVIFIFLILFIFATITFCFMISVFFSKANTASSVAGLAFFVSYAPYLFMQQNYETLLLPQKLAACLASNTAMAYGFQLILMHEGTGTGLQFFNIFSPVTPDDDLNMGQVMLLLIGDTFIYLFIALYVEAVFPGEYGVPQPWYFPITRTYWCGMPEYSGVEDISSKHAITDNIEQDPEGLNAGIHINGLRKVYSNKKVAVEGLTMNMYEDQITVLLGHNGAGKTTTMSMLTGMFPPSSGTATVNGFDIRKNIDGVRDSLGLCPQHNVLFSDLTVREHLYFFSKLKGLDEAEIEAEIEKYIRLLDLVPKADCMSSELSGGMQRKLSAGVALCGGSRVVLFDEPTSGMDPAARRALWDLLQSEKKGRTMLLSTHFMDEADLLGDRIAIMAGGRLQCMGSSFYLKKKFGEGYHLVIVKDAGCDASKVTDLLSKYIPNIMIESNIGTELSYLLSAEQSAIFEEMLRDLENHSEELKLLSYGVSLSTLEEVFMKVGVNESVMAMDSHQNGDKTNGFLEAEMKDNGTSRDFEYDIHSSETRLEVDQQFLVTGVTLILNQLQTMFTKKLIYTLRTWVMFIIQICIPVAFLIITIIVVRASQGGLDLPPMTLNLDPYASTVTVLSHGKHATTGTAAYDMFEKYQKMFKTSSKKTLKVIGEDDIEDFILEKSKTILPTVSMQYMVGATFESNDSSVTANAWFNNQAYHTIPVSLNLVHNAALKSFIGEDKYEIIVINEPLPFTAESRFNMLSTGNNMGFQLAFDIGFGLAFVSAFYILFYVKERVCKAKLLQIVSGVRVWTFWCSAFVWDMFTFVLTALCLIITMAAFQEKGIATVDELGRSFAVLICFGWAMLPLTYLASFFFDIPSTGFVKLNLIYIITGVACFMTVEILATPGLDLEDIAKILDWFFLIFPHYAVCTGFRNLNTITVTQEVCSKGCALNPAMCDPILMCQFNPKCCLSDNPYFDWEAPGIGRNMLYFMVVGVVLFLILLGMEYRLVDRIIYNVKYMYKGPMPSESEDGFLDSDVKKEKEKVKNLTSDEIESYNLVLRDFTKFYGKFLAVNQLCVSVSKAECFGLLGVNGAGKTSTFKMLTGDEYISAGDAWVKGLSLKSSIKKIHQLIGYCPQFDALIEDLTGRETIIMFCLLRGVPKNETAYVTKKLAIDLNFYEHIDKKVREYSGGNKRKLSTALALIGDPSVIYLDEPTTGMDPAAKRHLWNAICRVRDKGKCVILTSHSMEECEALCTRLAVMVNGEFKCLGSTQHLKNKFSNGYTLTIKVKKEREGEARIMGDQTITVNGRESITNGVFGGRIRKFSAQSHTEQGANGSQSSTLPRALQDHTMQGSGAYSLDDVQSYVLENFPKAVLKESYQCLLTYYIPDTEIPWSRMFGVMEAGKKELGIEDYSLGQTSLEQVFLSFAKKQRSEDGIVK